MTRRIFYMCFVLGLLSSCKTNDVTYLDDHYRHVSKFKYLNKIAQRDKYTLVETGMQDVKLYWRKKEYGRIEEFSEFMRILDPIISPNYKDKFPLVVIYYDGEDECTKSEGISYFYDFKTTLEANYNIEPLFLYCDSTGLSPQDQRVNWLRDPGKIFQRQIFQHNYLCESYVIIDPDGSYYANFGVFFSDDLIEILDGKMKE